MPLQTVLIAHPDVGVRHHLAFRLEQRYPAVAVVEAVDGLTACINARIDRPDLVFVAAEMAHLSGWDCAHYLQKYLPTCQVVVLAADRQAIDPADWPLPSVVGLVAPDNQDGLLGFLDAIDERLGVLVA